MSTPTITPEKLVKEFQEAMKGVTNFAQKLEDEENMSEFACDTDEGMILEMQMRNLPTMRREIEEEFIQTIKNRLEQKKWFYISTGDWFAIITNSPLEETMTIIKKQLSLQNVKNYGTGYNDDESLENIYGVKRAGGRTRIELADKGYSSIDYDDLLDLDEYPFENLKWEVVW